MKSKLGIENVVEKSGETGEGHESRSALRSLSEGTTADTFNNCQRILENDEIAVSLTG